jgi:hypothetical protein
LLRIGLSDATRSAQEGSRMSHWLACDIGCSRVFERGRTECWLRVIQKEYVSGFGFWKCFGSVRVSEG